MIKYLNGKKKNYLTLSTDDLKVIKWYVDASFAVHPDFKVPTGAIMTMVYRAMQSVSRGNKLNTRISIESKIVDVDDASVYILCVVLFI